jgi:hypothetical protein
VGIFSRKRGPVSTDGLLLDQTWDDPALDHAYAAVRHGDLSAGLDLLKVSPISTDLRAIRLTGLANAAIGRSEQLELQLQALPRDPDLLVWLAQTMVFEAWEVRTAKRAVHVSGQQFSTFFSILQSAHEVVAAAIQASPDDATPWGTLQWVGLGLQKSPGEKQLIFGHLLDRQPDSYLGHARQVQILAPKWTKGPVEDLLRFGRDTAYKSQPGRALGPGILALAFAEAAPEIMQDESMEREERLKRLQHLIYDRREMLVDAGAGWWRPGHQPEAADLEAHQAMAFTLRLLGRPELAMVHATQARGRVSFNPWAMSDRGHGVLTGFATAVAEQMRT